MESTVLATAIVFTLIIGFLLGFIIAYVLRGAKARDTQELVQQLIKQSEEQTRHYEIKMLEAVKGNFSDVSLQVMNKAQENFIQLAEAKLNGQTQQNAKELETKQVLIDQHLGLMNDRLKEVGSFVAQFEKRSSDISLAVMTKAQQDFLQIAEERFNHQTQKHTTELGAQKELIDQHLSQMDEKLKEVTNVVTNFEKQSAEGLGSLNNQLDKLATTSLQLQKALADNKTRGQWGERMAEDILRMMGLVEGINYEKQLTVNDGEETRIRPDFTFKLPNGMCLNMDSKFPLDNYLSFTTAESSADQDVYRRKFLSDVRSRVKEITGRAYINDTQNTVDCVLIFIPNEQVYRFIHESDDGIINEALHQKVVLCSPLTLFVVLAVVRQAVESFKLHKSSHEIVVHIHEFKKQWEKYQDQVNEVGSSLEKARKSYDNVIGVRQRMLEKPMNKIDLLLHDYGLDENATEIEPIP